MSRRIPLKQHTKLCFVNHEGGAMHFLVGRVIGLGGSCIVYDGCYRNNAGSFCTVRMKECYPHQLHLTRGMAGELFASERERQAFETYKERFRRSFETACGLHEAAGLTNRTVNVSDIYEGNGTVYIVTAYAEGTALNDTDFDTLKDAVRAVAATAKSIEKIHQKGYLYLDVKPENILVFGETPDLVQLVDFDSVLPAGACRDMTEFKISYSPGYAPLEQKLGDMAHIGTHTDVYSVGALLYDVLFGRAPRAVDCGADAVYDYSGIRWDAPFRGQLYKELTAFFHGTLQAYWMDRYRDMGAVVARLEKIERCADVQTPFFYSDFVPGDGAIVGRNRECGRLLEWLKSDERLIFVTGMGGIGKSTVVRKFAGDCRDMFDCIIFVQYRGSICGTVTDDAQFCINGYEKEDEERREDYFARKMKAARALARETNTLFIIDNFSGAFDEDFRELLRPEWKVIVVTRSDMSGAGFTCLKIGELDEKGELLRLFEYHLGRRLESCEYRVFEKIVRRAAGHTLLLALIAKQISKSYLLMDEALALIEANGFVEMAPEKICYVQDGNVFYDRISAILRALFDVSALSAEKRNCLKILSLSGEAGMELKMAQALLRYDSLDEFHELQALGWLEITAHTARMHPLVQEMICQVAWTGESRAIAVREMRLLLQKILQNGRQAQGRYDGPDYGRLQRTLALSKSVLLHAGRDAELCKEGPYKRLLLITLLNLPEEEESYIIGNAKRLFRDRGDVDFCALTELYAYVVHLLCQMRNYEAARDVLREAGSFARKQKSSYVRGLFYGMLADFYDELLGGAYHTREKSGLALLKKLLGATEQAIYFMRRSGHKNAKRYAAAYTLGRAAILMRSAPEKKKEIRALISGVKGIVEGPLQDAGIYTSYYMTRALYHTLCEPDKKAVLHFLGKAEKTGTGNGVPTLKQIDDFYIPAADMMCELGATETAFLRLEQAIALCDAHEEVILYIRKKRELLTYKLEVCDYEGYAEEYERVRERIGCVNSKAAEYRVFREMPEEAGNFYFREQCTLKGT